MNLKDRAAQLTEALALHGSAKKAAAALGMPTSSFTSFAYQCRRAGHDVPRILPPRLCSTKVFRALWDKGLSKREIATKLGVSLARVCDFVVNHHAELGINPKDRYLVKPLIQDIYIRLDPLQRGGEVSLCHRHTYKVSLLNFCPGNYGIWLTNRSMLPTCVGIRESVKDPHSRVHLYFLSNGLRWHRNPEGKLSFMSSRHWAKMLKKHPAWTGTYSFPVPLTGASPQSLDKFDEYSPRP